MGIDRPDGQVMQFGYDAGGRLATVTFSRGQLRYAYDTAGRVATVTAPEGPELAFSYDGFLPTAEEWRGAVSGRVERVYGTDFNTRDFLVDTERVNGAFPVRFRYDLNGRPTQAGALSLQRDFDHAEVTGTTLGVTTTALGYSGVGELTSLQGRASSLNVLFARYTRDPVGRITAITETAGDVTRLFEYGYDGVGRLESVRRDGTLVVRYTYDANGNRVQAEGERRLVTATYDPQDRLITYGTATYTYTPNGELASRTVGGQTTTYAYDTLGNLIQVRKPDGTVIRYLVDGRGRRVAKLVNDVRVKGWLYADQLRPIAELDGSGAIVSRFVYASRPNVPDYFSRGGKTYRIFADHLGSPRAVADADTGEVVQRLLFGAFGEVLEDTSPRFQPFGFAGGLYDGDTGLVRFGARDYDPETGRWTAKDPMGFNGGDPNLYTYVLLDPINLVDPRGLDWIASVGVSVTAGANLGFGIPFVGGGINIGLNLSTGQFFAQFTANATVGAGAFAGVGLQGSIGGGCGPLPRGFSTQTAAYAAANAGWGLAAGGSVTANAEGAGVGSSLHGRAARLGVGYGIGAGIGASTTTTYVPWGPLW